MNAVVYQQQQSPTIVSRPCGDPQSYYRWPKTNHLTIFCWRWLLCGTFLLQVLSKWGHRVMAYTSRPQVATRISLRVWLLSRTISMFKVKHSQVTSWLGVHLRCNSVNHRDGLSHKWWNYFPGQSARSKPFHLLSLFLWVVNGLMLPAPNLMLNFIPKEHYFAYRFIPCTGFCCCLSGELQHLPGDFLAGERSLWFFISWDTHSLLWN